MTPPRDAEREAVDFAVLALTRVRHTHMCGCDHQQTDPSCDVTLSVARQIRDAEQRGRRQMREAAAKTVREAFDGMCGCDRHGDGPHRLSCDAGIGDDLAEEIRALPDDTELG